MCIFLGFSWKLQKCLLISPNISVIIIYTSWFLIWFWHVARNVCSCSTLFSVCPRIPAKLQWRRRGNPCNKCITIVFHQLHLDLWIIKSQCLFSKYNCKWCRKVHLISVRRKDSWQQSTVQYRECDSRQSYMTVMHTT